jgi:hypothetical protein
MPPHLCASAVVLENTLQRLGLMPKANASLVVLAKVLPLQVQATTPIVRLVTLANIVLPLMTLVLIVAVESIAIFFRRTTVTSILVRIALRVNIRLQLGSIPNGSALFAKRVKVSLLLGRKVRMIASIV